MVKRKATKSTGPTDRSSMSDKDFLKFSKSESGKKTLKDERCVSRLKSRGYSLSRAQELCGKGLVRTMASDVKKVAKKVVGKVSNKIKKKKY
jgi:hypothetical protein